MSAKKKQTPAIETVDQLNSTVDDISRIQVEVRAKEAERDREIQNVRDRHDGVIETLKKTMKALLSLCETFGMARRETVFGKQKSTASALARYGFREGNPSLCLLNKKWSWDRVLIAIKDKGLSQYVRVIEEVDKEKLKGGKLSDEDLAAIGLRIDHKERFYVEPKVDDAERIVSDAAA